MGRGKKRERENPSEPEYREERTPSPPSSRFPSHFNREREREEERGRGRKRETQSRPSSNAAHATPSFSPNEIEPPKMFGTKLIALNLPTDSQFDEVVDYFADVGLLREFEFHYDHKNRFMGTASLEYVREKDAFAAADQLHGQRFSGHALHIIPLSSFSKR